MMFKKTTVLLLLAALSLGGLSGCASKYGQQTTTVNYYPQCYAPIKQLREEENRVAKSTAGGAVGGALLGALIGGLATGKAEGAVAGAAIGGVAGGTVGYAHGKQSLERDQNARMASYLRDLDGDISGLDAVTASARFSIQCYDKQFKQLVAGYKAGRVTRFDLDKSYEEIRNGIGEAERILGATLQNAYERDSQYQAAITDEAQKMGQPVPAASPAPKKRAPKASAAPKDSSLQAVQTKKDTYRAKIDDMENTKNDAAEKNRQYQQEIDLITRT